MSSKLHNPNRKPRKYVPRLKMNEAPKVSKNSIILEADNEATVEVKEVTKRFRNLKRKPVYCTEPECRFVTTKKSYLKLHKKKKHEVECKPDDVPLLLHAAQDCRCSVICHIVI